MERPIKFRGEHGFIKIGRPSKPDSLDQVISFSVTSEEAKAIYAQASQARVSVSRFLRHALGLDKELTGQMKTYLILDERARVKIGTTAGEVSKRIISLQCGNADALKVLCEIPGNHEVTFQQRFPALRLRGEWFTYRPEILQFAIELGGKTFSFNSNTEPSSIGVA